MLISRNLTSKLKTITCQCYFKLHVHWAAFSQPMSVTAENAIQPAFCAVHLAALQAQPLPVINYILALNFVPLVEKNTVPLSKLIEYL